MSLPVPASALLAVCAMIASLPAAWGQDLPRLRVSKDRRSLETAGGKPFLYLADTAWELFHRLSREEALHYLAKRKAQGFTAIQAVAVGELKGVDEANANGDLPFEDRDFTKPAEKYWEHVDFIIGAANERGLYVGLLPTWGGWVQGAKGKQDEPLLTPQNARQYGEFLGRRYGRKAVIWILGGDRTAGGMEETWRALAAGIEKTAGSDSLMTFHPRGSETSSTHFHADSWLDFNMWQTGHGLAEMTRPWEKIRSDWDRKPAKPVVDGEPLYEDHPLAFRARQYGYSMDAHVRQRAYWALLAGACGFTYGHHSVWQMYDPAKRKPVNGPLLSWRNALDRPAANQMRHVRTLWESVNFAERVPDDGLVSDLLKGSDRIAAARGKDWAIIYSGSGRPFHAVMGRIPGATVRIRWFNPRSGEWLEEEEAPNEGNRAFTCPSEGFASDWVLVLRSAAGR
jgi:hypothetical protein